MNDTAYSAGPHKSWPGIEQISRATIIASSPLVERRFAEHAPKFEPHEEKVSGHVKSLVDAGVELVTNVRKQEAAVQTWFVKAFTRDRDVAK